jgi:hypothetical protein
MPNEIVKIKDSHLVENIQETELAAMLNCLGALTKTFQKNPVRSKAES